MTLNCNGNSITGVGQRGIDVSEVSNLLIENCKVATGTGQGTSALLKLSRVNGGTVIGSAFGTNEGNLGGVQISDSTNVTFGSQMPGAPANPSITPNTNPSVSGLISNAPAASNTVFGFLRTSSNVGLLIDGNAFTAGSSTLPAAFMIGLFGNQNSRVLNNSVNGLGNPVAILLNGILNVDTRGSDDDIIVEDETGPSLISGNVLVNTYDCGIETFGFMKNITLSNNYIDTVAIGFGGWYYLSVSNAQFTQNVMTNIGYMGFRYFRIGGLRAAGAQTHFSYKLPSDMPAETTVNFTQNRFTSNILSQPLVSPSTQLGSAEVDVFSSLAYVKLPAFPGTDPKPEQFITVGNTFTNNSFEKAYGPLTFAAGPPWTYTSGDVVDGGGNTCAGSQTSLPAVSPTFGNYTGTLDQSTPIDCGNGN